MPEDSKKHQQKAKHEAKEQRKPRQSRQASADKKSEKKVEEPNVPVPSKPVYEDPGPEFYNSLKRETDEILKITEEANSKYKKKEIQSNWSKYEMPIDTYEEMEAQDNLGADYEKIIQAPQSIGGHFQFKHEKTWDISTAPSLYDKYFEINMENLATALSTIPFYERNGMEKSNFSDIDVLNMENRATRYKQKYYNDKSYTTPELDAQDKILHGLKGNISKSNEKHEDISNLIENKVLESKDIVFEEITNASKSEITTASKPEINEENRIVKNETEVDIKLIESKNLIENTTLETKKLLNAKEKILEKTERDKTDEIDEILENIGTKVNSPPLTVANEIKHTHEKKEIEKVADTPTNETKKPVMESPEDLEKWLDDFLDG